MADISKTSHELRGEHLWFSLPEDVRKIIHPCLTSQLNLNVNFEKQPQRVAGAKATLFTIHGKESFKAWISSWTSHLIYRYQSIAPHEPRVALFKACRGVIKDDVDIALFLLPHLLLSLLATANVEANTEIADEIICVLNASAGTISTPYLGVRPEVLQMTAQTMFSCIDHLMQFTRWVTRKKASILNATGTMQRRPSKVVEDSLKENDQHAHAVITFIDQIPKAVMAQAAFQCRDFARALLLFEAHMRALRFVPPSFGTGTPPAHAPPTAMPLVPPGKPGLPDDWDFLQQIYSKLQEPDGIAGIAAGRDDLSLNAQILDHKALGRWTHALSCYEQALQLWPHELTYHKGLLECQMNLGHLETTVTHATGILARKPEWEYHLNTFRVHAAWRLGDWTQLDKFLRVPCQPDFDIALGRIIWAARRVEVSEFLQLIHSATDDVTTSLSALSLEFGSYERAYKHILRLHMLHEFKTLLLPVLVTLNPSDPASTLGLSYSSNPPMLQAFLPVTGPPPGLTEEHFSRHLLMGAWSSRIDMLRPSVRAREPGLVFFFVFFFYWFFIGGSFFLVCLFVCFFGKNFIKL